MNAPRIHVLRFGWSELPGWKRALVLGLGAAVAIAAALLLSIFVLLLVPLALLAGLLARFMFARGQAPNGERAAPGMRDATIEGEWTVIEERRAPPAERRD